jgi:hypothetical protein
MSSSNIGRTITLIGGPSTGKTVYTTQLFGRLRRRISTLQLRDAPQSLAPLDAALDSLSRGFPPAHTGENTYHEINIPLVDQYGDPVDLVWPDYGGEQIRDVLDTRQVPKQWHERIASGVGWILCIRPERLRNYDDIFVRPDDASPDPPDQEQNLQWSDQARLIELVQILLFVRGMGITERVEDPPLTVLLTCWDEILSDHPAAQPVEELRSRLPLFADFLESNWKEPVLDVLGLSSQGKALSLSEADDEYIDRGPHHFGYVVLPDGTRDNDITLPISRLLARVKHP